MSGTSFRRRTESLNRQSDLTRPDVSVSPSLCEEVSSGMTPRIRLHNTPLKLTSWRDEGLRARLRASDWRASPFGRSAVYWP